MSLSRIVDLVVGVAAIAVVATLAKNVLTPSVVQEGRAKENVVAVGEPLMHFVQGRATVVLFASERCQYCEASLPFYASLAREGASGGRFDLAVAVPSITGSKMLRDFFAKGGVAEVRWVEASPPPGISGVPAVVAVDASGKVMASWMGKMSESQERALLAMFSD